MVASITAPVYFQEQAVPFTVSMGVVTFPEGGEDAATLLHNADLALYGAKTAGRNRIRVLHAQPGIGRRKQIQA